MIKSNWQIAKTCWKNTDFTTDETYQHILLAPTLSSNLFCGRMTYCRILAYKESSYKHLLLLFKFMCDIWPKLWWNEIKSFVRSPSFSIVFNEIIRYLEVPFKRCLQTTNYATMFAILFYDQTDHWLYILVITWTILTFIKTKQKINTEAYMQMKHNSAPVNND